MTGWEYYNMDDEVKERLQRKSYWLFKSKHLWRKIEDRTGCGIAELERRFDLQIELTEKKLSIVRKLKTEESNVKELNRSNVRRNERRSKKSSSK